MKEFQRRFIKEQLENMLIAGTNNGMFEYEILSDSDNPAIEIRRPDYEALYPSMKVHKISKNSEVNGRTNIADIYFDNYVELVEFFYRYHEETIPRRDFASIVLQFLKDWYGHEKPHPRLDGYKSNNAMIDRCVYVSSMYYHSDDVIIRLTQFQATLSVLLGEKVTLVLSENDFSISFRYSNGETVSFEYDPSVLGWNAALFRWIKNHLDTANEPVSYDTIIDLSTHIHELLYDTILKNK